MGANILLFVCSNILGAIDFYIADRRQRRSVLETRQSLEVKITLESENRQQVCYLATPLTLISNIQTRAPLLKSLECLQFLSLFKPSLSSFCSCFSFSCKNKNKKQKKVIPFFFIRAIEISNMDIMMK